MKILLAGDVHGRWGEFNSYLQRIHQYYRFEMVLQLGDFGFYPEIMEHFIGEMGRFSFPIYAIDGNHEHHDWLAGKTENDFANWREKLNLSFLSRASVLEIAGTRIGCIGGALHVDRPQRVKAKITNFVSAQDRFKAMDTFNQNPLDLIVSHSAPSAIGVKMNANPIFDMGVNLHIKAAGFDAGPRDDCGEMELANIWKQLKNRPKHWVFGHFHVAHRAVVEGTSFWGVPEFDKPPLLFWDSELKDILMVE